MLNFFLSIWIYACIRQSPVLTKQMLSNIEKHIVFLPKTGACKVQVIKLMNRLYVIMFKWVAAHFQNQEQLTTFKHAVGVNDQLLVMAPDFENPSICDYLFSSNETKIFLEFFSLVYFCTSKCIRRFYVFDLLKCCE